MRGRLVSEGLSLSVLSLAGDQRQLPCGDDYKEYVVHLDSGFAIHCRPGTIFRYLNTRDCIVTRTGRDHNDIYGPCGNCNSFVTHLTSHSLLQLLPHLRDASRTLFLTRSLRWSTMDVGSGLSRSMRHSSIRLCCKHHYAGGSNCVYIGFTRSL